MWILQRKQSPTTFLGVSYTPTVVENLLHDFYIWVWLVWHYMSMRMRIYLFELTDVNKAIFISVKYLEGFPKIRLHIIWPVPDDDDEEEDDEDDDDNDEVVMVVMW